MLDGGANVCAIGGIDRDIVYRPEDLRRPIAVEGVHGTPPKSKIKLDAKGSICLLGVMVKVYLSEHLTTSIVSDGVLTSLGFEVMKSKKKVAMKPPNSTTWCELAGFQSAKGEREGASPAAWMYTPVARLAPGLRRPSLPWRGAGNEACSSKGQEYDIGDGVKGVVVREVRP